MSDHVLVFSYLAKFLGSLDCQYETLFGGTESSNEISGIETTLFKKKEIS
jgi:hypothetical protein